MSITDITQAPGFNQQQYEQLVQNAKTQKVDVNVVDMALLQAVNNGKSFDEALKLVTTELPKLAEPNYAALKSLGNWPALPAPGALIMSLITKMSAEQRQQNKELMWAQTEAVVESMKDQADKMRTMAAIQLAMGIVSSATNIAGGLAQAKMSWGATGNAIAAQGVGTAVGGGAKVFEAVGGYVGSMYQAEFKVMEADQEKMRSTRESMKSFNDALSELIQKSLSSQESIQQSKNQATTRILA